MTTINLIGSGNVAWHLFQFIQNNTELHLQNWYARTLDFDIPNPEIFCTNIQDLKPAAVTILAISDDAISLVSSQLSFSNELVVHTSGTVSIDKIDSKNRAGVFYPLQSFSKNKAIDFSQIPILIESQNNADELFLKKLATVFSQNVTVINSNQRLALHVAAVFANNFVNLMYQKAYKICEENQLDFNILLPLIKETQEKIMSLNPIAAQTGPAKRKDFKTINTHQEFLKNTTFLDLYKTLTQEILTTSFSSEKD